MNEEGKTEGTEALTEKPKRKYTRRVTVEQVDPDPEEVKGKSVDDFIDAEKPTKRERKSRKAIETPQWVDGGTIDLKTGKVKKPRKKRGPNKKKIKVDSTAPHGKKQVKGRKAAPRRKAIKRMPGWMEWPFTIIQKLVLRKKKKRGKKTNKRKGMRFQLTITLRIK